MIELHGSTALTAVSRFKCTTSTKYMLTSSKCFRSMYFDEDGDLAHEFYEEVKKRGGSKMKRVSSKNLIPQGDVEYQHPRLHVDFPIIMYQG